MGALKACLVWQASAPASLRTEGWGPRPAEATRPLSASSCLSHNYNFLHPFTGRNAGTLCSHTALGTNSGQFYFATGVKGELTPVMILSSEIYSLAQRYVTNEEPSPFTTKIHRPFQLPPLSLNPESTFLGGLCSGPPGRLELGPVLSLTGSRGTTVLLLGNWCICLMICGAT